MPTHSGGGAIPGTVRYHAAVMKPPSSALLPEKTSSLPTTDRRSSLRRPWELRHDLLTKQLGMSTVIALPSIDRYIRLMARDGVAGECLLDLGSKWGMLGAYIAASLGLTELICVDRFEDVLIHAEEKEGARVIRADLSTDLPLPLSDGSAAVITSFGAMEHLPWFDDFLREAHRLLAPGGFLLLSTPNLGSYLNRAAVLAGYQPRDVEVARTLTPGLLPIYRSDGQRRPLGHPHVATLRTMRELLVLMGFEVLATTGFGPPGDRAQRVLDRVFNRFPSLSRRVLILARSTATTGARDS